MGNVGGVKEEGSLNRLDRQEETKEQEGGKRRPLGRASRLRVKGWEKPTQSPRRGGAKKNLQSGPVKLAKESGLFDETSKKSERTKLRNLGEKNGELTPSERKKGAILDAWGGNIAGHYCVHEEKDRRAVRLERGRKMVRGVGQERREKRVVALSEYTRRHTWGGEKEMTGDHTKNRPKCLPKMEDFPRFRRRVCQSTKCIPPESCSPPLLMGSKENNQWEKAQGPLEKKQQKSQKLLCVGVKKKLSPKRVEGDSATRGHNACKSKKLEERQRGTDEKSRRGKSEGHESRLKSGKSSLSASQSGSPQKREIEEDYCTLREEAKTRRRKESSKKKEDKVKQKPETTRRKLAAVFCGKKKKKK